MIKKRKTKTKKNKKLKYVWITMIVVFSALFVNFTITGINDALAFNRKDNTVQIEIPKGSSISEIASILKENNVIDHKVYFEMYAVMRGASKNFIAGHFEIKTNLDYEAIISFIQSNENRSKDDLTKVTIPEGLSVIECAKLLEDNHICDANEFIEACNDKEILKEYSFLQNIPTSENKYYQMEGYLFPDTYDFYKDQKASKVVYRLLNNYEYKLSEKNSDGLNIAQRAEKLGYTLDELMTIASIIQAEAADEDDMPKVSSVIHNRLKTKSNDGVTPFGDYGMKLLHMDSTVWYPYPSKGHIPDNQKNSFQSKYDTYKYEGLPPGPICNPGISAINAALRPANTEYYFFCHDNNKNAYYAKTSSEHSENLKKAGLN